MRERFDLVATSGYFTGFTTVASFDSYEAAEDAALDWQNRTGPSYPPADVLIVHVPNIANTAQQNWPPHVVDYCEDLCLTHLDDTLCEAS